MESLLKEEAHKWFNFFGKMRRNIGILLFDDVEVLDFAGPFEVFSVTSELNNFELLNVFTVAEKQATILAKNGLMVSPKYDIDNAPKIDVLIIPGGDGAKKILDNEIILNWINEIHQTTEITMSVCSGATVLGKLKLLDGLPYCTHHLVYERMGKIAPTALAQKDKRFVAAGKVYTSGGISAGIDLSFHLVEQFFGKAVAQKTAEYMEYRLS